MGQVADRLEPDESKMFSEALDNVVIAGKADEVMKQCISRCRISRLREKEERILVMLSMADEENNLQSAHQLTVELMEIQKEIEAHGGKSYVK